VVRFGRTVGQTRHPIASTQADPSGGGGLHPAVLEDKFHEFEVHCWGEWPV